MDFGARTDTSTVSSRPHDPRTPSGRHDTKPSPAQPIRLSNDDARTQRRRARRDAAEADRVQRVRLYGAMLVTIGCALVIALGAASQAHAEAGAFATVAPARADGRAGTGRHYHVHKRTARSAKQRAALAALTKQQETLNRQAAAITARITALGDARDAAADAEAAARAAYEQHLVALYRSSDSAGLAAIIASRSVSDVVDQTQLALQLASHDKKIVDEYARASERVQALSTEQSQLTDQLVATNDALDGVTTELAAFHTTVTRDPVVGGKAGMITGANMFYTTKPLPLFGAGVTLPTSMTPFTSTTPPPASTMPDGYEPTGATEDGTASWYGPGFDGHKTANGEIYNQEGLTAAHRTLPLGTWIKVTSGTTGKTVFVRINDRGPFVDDRVLDLSHGAAVAIGLEGIGPVHIEVYGPPGAAPTPFGDGAPTPPAAPATKK